VFGGARDAAAFKTLGSSNEPFGCSLCDSVREVHEHRTSPRSRVEMAYGIVHHFPGGTKENYEASVAAVHPSDGSLPDGQIFHAAGPSEGGWTIIAVHESQASWEKFRDGTLMPKLQAGIEGGFPTPPQEIAIDLQTLRP
jgi:hypothetical protein